MNTLLDLHDGFFDGLWIAENKSVCLFVRTETGERSTIVLNDVAALNIWNLRPGNIIFDVVLVPPEELSVALVEQLHALTPENTEMTQRLLAKAQQQGLSALIINPSYGAEGAALFRTSEILPGYVLAHLKT